MATDESCIVSGTACIPLVLAIVALSCLAQDNPIRERGDQVDQRLLREFGESPASELVTKYFQGPPYPLFVIRRLIDLGDPQVIPALRAAFSLETDPVPRQFLAAALVRLADPDPQYFSYLAKLGRDAVTNDLPYSGDSNGKSDDLLRFPAELGAWARTHGVTVQDALRRAMIELPGTVEAMGEAADRRYLPILLRGLSSPNVLVVRTSAFGLARLHDTSAVGPIIKACARLRGEGRPTTAKALLYFETQDAQSAAEALIGNPQRVRNWRMEVKRRGWKSAMKDTAIDGLP